MDAEGVPVEGGIRAQTEAVFDRIADVLAAAGGTMADVVKVTYFLVDIADLEVVREVIRERLPDPKPASSLVQVSALVDSRFRLEIETVATVPQL